MATIRSTHINTFRQPSEVQSSMIPEDHRTGCRTYVSKTKNRDHNLRKWHQPLGTGSKTSLPEHIQPGVRYLV